MSKPASPLVSRAPDWFEMVSTGASGLVGIARIPGTVWSGSGVELAITDLDKPKVGEAIPGTVFPARCPERHIQGDKSFCVGLRKIEIWSDEAADQWWEQLRQYVVCQSIAHQTGVWPPEHSLDHGAAGLHHERCLILASELGLDEAYAAARLDEPSWITDPDLRLTDRSGRPINGRGPCPLGCRTRSRPSRLVVRRKCAKRGLILELVVEEARRRTALEQYWKNERIIGTRCCGTMLSCKLRVLTGGAESSDIGSGVTTKESVHVEI